MSTAGQCGICRSDRLPVVNAFLAAGRTAQWIEREMKNLNSPTKAETVRKHLNNCLNGNAAQNAPLLEKAAGANGNAISSNHDFAAAVRAEANRMLAAGDLQIRTEHGLQAQALIDRRAEKQADRRLMVEMARLLSGGALGLMSAPDDVIEGEYVDVTDQPDLNPDAGLAPLALVAEK